MGAQGHCGVAVLRPVLHSAVLSSTTAMGLWSLAAFAIGLCVGAFTHEKVVPCMNNVCSKCHGHYQDKVVASAPPRAA
eukprot:NODE_7885_length_414_cov_227.896936.p3 GENE.NODE_7885_length_414_cov_227.896936~~NODE_7885_length_414_cov_227.896936.p3  ORF type:complete len:78 (-),score=17.86 NODE_7885_length_414_cov_227.896936:163-396(-)